MELSLSIATELQDLFNFKDIDVKEHPSEFSLSKSIFTSIGLKEALEEIRSLSKSVKLEVLEVDVVFERKMLRIIERESSKADQFFNLRSKNTKIIWIYSTSVRMIDAKLAVYKKYAKHLDLKNTLLYHTLEKHDEICKFSGGEKLASLCDYLAFIKNNILSCVLEDILKLAVEKVLLEENIKKACNAIDLWDGKNHVGTINSPSYRCRSAFTIRRIANNLRKKTLEHIANELASEICKNLLKDIESKLQKDLKREFFRLPIVLPGYYLPGNMLPIGLAIAAVFIPSIGPFIAIATLISTFIWSVDFTSENCRNKVADDIFVHISQNKQSLMQEMSLFMRKICEHTLKDLDSVYNQVQYLKKTIAPIDQQKLVNEWMKRDIIHDKVGLLATYPSVVTYIAGRENGDDVVKVFLTCDDEEAKQYILRMCRWKYTVQFINITNILKKNSEKREGNILKRSIDKTTQARLCDIVQREGETLMAKHSTILGIGIGLVHQIGDPCIVLFCIDKELVPFGESIILSEIEGYPIDIRYQLT